MGEIGIGTSGLSFAGGKPKKDLPSCDKGGHKERSLANDPRPNGHRKYWKKKEKEDLDTK